MIYLDNNATTQPAPQVAQAMDEANRDLWANPSSVHRFGQQARQRVELARNAVANLLGCRDREIVFTSGGTESNNLALWGLLGPQAGALHRGIERRVLITTAVEHAAVREPGEALEEAGIERAIGPVDGNGVVDLKALREALDEHSGGDAIVLVSIQWANNETGGIQPIDTIGKLVDAARERGINDGGKRNRVLLHVDATQAVGKLPIDLKQSGVDLATFAAHKFHGPKGIGGLFVRSGVRIQPLQRGGPQERERRGGTENVPAILGLGVAAALARDFVQDVARLDARRALRDRFERAICEACDEVTVNAAGADRLWNTSNLGFRSLEAEAILLGLSERGVCASAGAACSSGSLEPSPVLLAMGIEEPVAHGSVRFSLSRFTTEQEIDQATAIVPEVVRRLRKTLPK